MAWAVSQSSGNMAGTLEEKSVPALVPTPALSLIFSLVKERVCTSWFLMALQHPGPLSLPSHGGDNSGQTTALR